MPYRFARDWSTYVYEVPSDPGPAKPDVALRIVVASVASFEEGMSGSAALVAAVAEVSERRKVEVEVGDPLPNTEVPFALIRYAIDQVFGDRRDLIWATKDGSTIFTLSSNKVDDLAAITRAVVADLKREPADCVPAAGAGSWRLG